MPGWAMLRPDFAAGAAQFVQQMFIGNPYKPDEFNISGGYRKMRMKASFWPAGFTVNSCTLTVLPVW